MTAVGRAVRREVGLFVVGGSVLEGSWPLHKVDLCVSSWREVWPLQKVEICLKNFDVTSSLVGDFSLVIHWKRSWSLSLLFLVLCNDAGWLSSDETCQVCTHDKLKITFLAIQLS